MDDRLSRGEALSILSGRTEVPKEDLQRIKLERSEFLTYSRNIFLPLTRVCMNKCGYCTFRREAETSKRNVMSSEEITKALDEAERSRCHEVLFAFGERSDADPMVKEELNDMGYGGIIEYLYEISGMILSNYDMLVHTNGGLLDASEMRLLREVTASMGLMLETSSPRLMRTVAHKDSPGKEPAKRIKMIQEAGKLRIPFTTGLLIGIGETDEEIYDSLAELRRVQDRYGNLQELIIQNFLPKEGTPMERFPAPKTSKIASVLTLARMMFPDLSIQLPPNLNSNDIEKLIQYGVDDLGGISPLTIDHINPESPWPMEIVDKLKIRERLAVYPRFIDKEYLSELNYRKAIKLTGSTGHLTEVGK